MCPVLRQNRDWPWATHIECGANHPGWPESAGVFVGRRTRAMMKRNAWRWAVGLSPVALLVLWATLPATGQAQTYGTQNGEWQTYGGDLKSTRYSPLDQITADNFNKIEVAWRFKTDNLGPRPEFNLEGTPLMVKGVLYFTGGTRRAAVALDAATGEMLWMHTMNEGKRGESAPRQLSGRG